MTGLYSCCVVACALVAQPASTPPVEVRVGIVAYEDFQAEIAQFQSIFAEITRRDPALHFQLAVGSYGHVLHWLDRQLIDVAILTPGVFARVLMPEGDSWSSPLCEYLATVQLPAAKSSWATASRRSTDFSNDYRSVCLVADDSPIASLEDMRRLASQRKLEFLFVHPLSVSGRAAPCAALHAAGIAVEEVPTRFTYSHSQSIRMLTDPAATLPRVAFVWDDAAGLNKQLESGVRRLPFPELDALKIPHDVVVARTGFAHAARVRGQLLEPLRESSRYRFLEWEGWQRRYGTVRNWLEQAGAISEPEDGEQIALDEIGHLLLQYARSHDKPPRLALVLSGGGAKCSYQIGAVSAIEQTLADLRRENPSFPIDVDLVVGTSGGAINALPVALGVTGAKEGREALVDTWTQLNQCEIIRPPLIVRVNMGLWFALLQTAVVVALVRWRVQDTNRRSWTFAAVYASLAGVEVLMGYFAPPPWHLLGAHHVLHHVWLWFSFGVKSSAWFLFAIGVGALVLQTLRARRGDRIHLPRRLTRTTLAIGLLGLPLLQVITLVAVEETLSSGEGMEHALASKFPPLINRYLDSQHLLPLELPAGLSPDERLQDVSRQILRRGLLRRDLVLTGSCLDQTSQELPSALYFDAPADPDADQHPYGPRGLPLAVHPQILLDVIMGSGSIYPLFPARRINDFPRRGQYIELVDGGFAHNSPVEAAVLWGATHIILIDVMEQGPMRRGNFLQNAISSVRHLHRQAQLLDARSRERVTIFTLSPAPPHICIIDFADNLVQQSIDQGYRDARLGATGVVPRFRKELGQPVFQQVVP